MYPRETGSGWRADSRWLCGIVLVLATTAAALLFSLTGLARPVAGTQVLERLLGLALQSEGGVSVSADSGAAWLPGTPLQLLHGLEVYADPTEVSSFSTDDAANRIAGVLTDSLLQGGTPAVLALSTDSTLSTLLTEALEGPVLQLVRGQLGAALLPAGLADGSRLADWRTQAAGNPGAPVQPVVGVFVTADPALVGELTAAGIGDLVIAGLADSFVSGGSAAGRDVLANNTLLGLYDSAVNGPLASGLHGLFAGLLLGFRAELDSGLSQAQAALQAGPAARQPLAASGGIVSSSELANLSRAEADALIVRRLAERAHADGPDVLQQLLTDRGQQAAAQAAAPLLALFSWAAAERWGLSAWFAAAVGLLAAALLVLLSSGRGRLFNPGLALLVAGTPGLLSVRWLQTMQAGFVQAGQAEGAGFFGGLLSDLRALAGAIPAGPAEAVALPWLVVTGAGALLVLLTVLALLVPARRRGGRYRF